MTRQLPLHLDAYLARIGADRPPQADTAALRELQLRHLLTVPFENLSIHLGEPIVLDSEALVDKLVQLLVFGCGYRRIADATRSATTLRRRRDEWISAGVANQLRLAVLGAYDCML